MNKHSLELYKGVRGENEASIVELPLEQDVARLDAASTRTHSETFEDKLFASMKPIKFAPPCYCHLFRVISDARVNSDATQNVHDAEHEVQEDVAEDDEGDG